MSNLDHPISILVAEGRRVSHSIPASNEDTVKKVSQLNGLNRAIQILLNEQKKDEMKEREKKEKPIPYVKKL